MNNKWEHYSHTADMGIRGFGDTIEEAFEAAAIAMTAVIVEPQKIQPNEKVTITCNEQDNELLFIEWLNNILYEMSTRQMVFSKFEISIENDKLTGFAYGEKLDISKHEPASEIKGISYCDLKVANENSKWIAQCIVDI